MVNVAKNKCLLFGNLFCKVSSVPFSWHCLDTSKYFKKKVKCLYKFCEKIMICEYIRWQRVAEVFGLMQKRPKVWIHHLEAFKTWWLQSPASWTFTEMFEAALYVVQSSLDRGRPGFFRLQLTGVQFLTPWLNLVN